MWIIECVVCKLVISQAEESSVGLLCTGQCSGVIIKLPPQHNSATLPHWTPAHTAGTMLQLDIYSISTVTGILQHINIYTFPRLEHFYTNINCTHELSIVL